MCSPSSGEMKWLRGGLHWPLHPPVVPVSHPQTARICPMLSLFSPAWRPSCLNFLNPGKFAGFFCYCILKSCVFYPKPMRQTFLNELFHPFNYLIMFLECKIWNVILFAYLTGFTWMIAVSSFAPSPYSSHNQLLCTVLNSCLSYEANLTFSREL